MAARCSPDLNGIGRSPPGGARRKIFCHQGLLKSLGAMVVLVGGIPAPFLLGATVFFGGAITIAARISRGARSPAEGSAAS